MDPMVQIRFVLISVRDYRKSSGQHDFAFLPLRWASLFLFQSLKLHSHPEGEHLLIYFSHYSVGEEKFSGLNFAFT